MSAMSRPEHLRRIGQGSGWSVEVARLSRPGTRHILEPVYDHEQLIIADLNLSEIDQEFLTLDVSGHYSRSDVFKFDTKTK